MHLVLEASSEEVKGRTRTAEERGVSVSDWFFFVSTCFRRFMKGGMVGLPLLLCGLLDYVLGFCSGFLVSSSPTLTLSAPS